MLSPGTRSTFSVEAGHSEGFSEPATSSSVWTFAPPARVTGLTAQITDAAVTLI